jgi:hypothetical protein
MTEQLWSDMGAAHAHHHALSEADVLGLLCYMSAQASFTQALRLFLVQADHFDDLFYPLFDENGGNITEQQSYILEQASTLLRKALGDEVPETESYIDP